MQHPACQRVFPLFLNHRSELKRFVARKVKDEALAEDLVSELSLKLYEHCERIPALQNPRAWLFRLAANAVADHYRQQQREDRLRSQMPLALASDQPVDPAEAEHCVRCLLRELPERYQVPSPWWKWWAFPKRRQPSAWPSPTLPSKAGCSAAGNN